MAPKTLAEPIKISESDLLNYSHAMIRYAVYNHPDVMIAMLQNNGVAVPDNATKVMLHTMVLQAMVSSQSFQADLATYLSDVAMQGQYQKYEKIKGNNYAHTDGVTNTTAVDPNADSPTFWSQIVNNPTTVNAIVATGLGIINKQIGSTPDAIPKAVVPPKETPTPPKSHTGLYVGIFVALGLGIAGVLYWRSRKAGK